MKDNPHVSRKEMSEQLNISSSAIQKHIKMLKEQGFIVRIGSAKGGIWNILKEADDLSK